MGARVSLVGLAARPDGALFASGPGPPPLNQAALNVFIFLLLSNIAFVTYACARKCASGEMKAEDVPFFTVTVGFHITFNFKNLIDMMPRLLKMLLPLYRVLDHLSSRSTIEPNPNSLPEEPPIQPPGGRFRGAVPDQRGTQRPLSCSGRASG